MILPTGCDAAWKQSNCALACQTAFPSLDICTPLAPPPLPPPPPVTCESDQYGSYCETFVLLPASEPYGSCDGPYQHHCLASCQAAYPELGISCAGAASPAPDLEAAAAAVDYGPYCNDAAPAHFCEVQVSNGCTSSANVCKLSCQTAMPWLNLCEEYQAPPGWDTAPQGCVNVNTDSFCAGYVDDYPGNCHTNIWTQERCGLTCHVRYPSIGICGPGGMTVPASFASPPSPPPPSPPPPTPQMTTSAPSGLEPCPEDHANCQNYAQVAGCQISSMQANCPATCQALFPSLGLCSFDSSAPTSSTNSLLDVLYTAQTGGRWWSGDMGVIEINDQEDCHMLPKTNFDTPYPLSSLTLVLGDSAEHCAEMCLDYGSVVGQDCWGFQARTSSTQPGEYLCQFFSQKPTGFAVASTQLAAYFAAGGGMVDCLLWPDPAPPTGDPHHSAGVGWTIYGLW